MDREQLNDRLPFIERALYPRWDKTLPGEDKTVPAITAHRTSYTAPYTGDIQRHAALIAEGLRPNVHAVMTDEMQRMQVELSGYVQATGRVTTQRYSVRWLPSSSGKRP